MLSTGCFINQNSLMEYFVFYGELILTFVKAAFCANQNIHGVLLHTANRFVCRSGYGVKIFLAVVNNNVEVKVAIGMGCAVCKRAEQINTSGTCSMSLCFMISISSIGIARILCLLS